MSHRLINLSQDLRRLREEGYDVSIESAHLVLRSIPFVNSRREVRDGVLVSNLRLAGDITAAPDTHVVWFIGEHPCNIDGTEIVQLTHENRVHDIAPGLRVDRSFSCKPDGGYLDYYEKMVRYSQIISAPAAAIDASATPRPAKPVESYAGESVFKYLDTSSALSGISAISSKLTMDRVAIVGLGGSGGTSWIKSQKRQSKRYIFLTATNSIHTMHSGRRRPRVLNNCGRGLARSNILPACTRTCAMASCLIMAT